MNNNIKVGIPRALLYYKYADLWENFFYELDIEVVYSPETNISILERGKDLGIDESCLALKIFLGHVYYLKDKVDCLLVPRIKCLKKGEKVCTNFNALYDIVNNLLNIKIIDYNIDVERGCTEKKAFIKLGKALNKGKNESLRAYKRAKRIVNRSFKHKSIKQELLINESKKTKILLVGHPYNVYDELIGKRIISQLQEQDIDIIYADIFDKNMIVNKYLDLSPHVYWTYSKELLGSIVHYKDKVDGIILLSVFPCGPDSLTNEICMRRINIPITNIIIDELTGEAGLQTRIESFIDIIKEQERLNERKNNYFS